VYTGKDTTEYMGVEYEVEIPKGSNYDLALIDVNEFAKIPKLPAWCFTKRDGSLRHGFEIVSAPATLEVHKNEFKWTGLVECLANKHKVLLDGASTAGLHVHANRRVFTRGDEIKLAYFMYTHRNKMIQIARRVPNNFCRFKRACDLPRVLSDDYIYQPDRYEALNWQNANTVEFRLFKSTGRVKDIYSALEFVDAMIHFIPTLSKSTVEDKRKAWLGFMKFLEAKQDIYINLLKHLIEKKEA
jgi:hypothetical protein